MAAMHFPLAEAQPLVSIVDDEEPVRSGLARLFRSVHLPAATFASAQAYLAAPPHAGPACVILDFCMPGTNGLEVQKALAERKEQIIFLTGHADVPVCAQAMKAGAVDFLTKPVDDDDLLKAVRCALTRSLEIRQAAAQRASARARLDLLTPREFEVMQRVIAGCMNKHIADDLGASEKTVKIHRGRVMTKMGARSVADLVRVAQTACVAPVFSNG